MHFVILRQSATNWTIICFRYIREKLKRKLELAGTMCNMEGLTAAAADFNFIGKKKFPKKISGNFPTNKVKANSKGNKTNREDDKGKSNAKPPKGKQSKRDPKKRSSEDGEDNSTLMKRRRKTELQVQVI